MNETIVYSIAWIALIVFLGIVGGLIYFDMQNGYNLRTRCIEQQGIYVYQVGCIIDKDIRP